MTTSPKPADEELDEAFRKIYKRYGPNLAAFFKDVHEQLKREANSEEKTHTVSILK